MDVTCEVKFHHPNAIYFCGQNVSGTILIKLKKLMKVRGITFTIHGSAHTNWDEDDPAGARDERRPQFIRYHAKEDYFSTTKYLIGSESGTAMELRPGVYSYNFCCSLPSILPSSFEGSHGYIRYVAKTVFEKPWQIRNDSHTVGFTVLKRVDLNYDSPLLRIPSQMEIMKEFCCGPCRTKPLAISVTIPQSGYVPGEIISISADVNNKSRVRVSYIDFTLRKLINYASTTPKTKRKEEIIEVVKKTTTSSVESNSTKRIEEAITIPPMPPTNIYPCRIIQIAYDIKIEAHVPGLHTNPSTTIPITLGTIPLTSLIKSYPNLPYRNSICESLHSIELPSNFMSQRNSMAADAKSLSSTTANLPPPSYEEALDMRRTNLNDDEDEEQPISPETVVFTPRYPVYNFSAYGSESTLHQSTIHLAVQPQNGTS